MRLSLLTTSGLALTIAACHMHSSPTPAATAVMRSSTGDSLGVLSFFAGDDANDGIHITGTLTGLRPGVHGIHLHAVGMCDAPGFTSAGGHINPMGRHHGLDNPNGPHAGDLPNITVNANRVVNIDLTTKNITLAQIRDADGSAVVVHADPDDQRSDPAGNAGGRVACGVIR